MSRNEYLRQWQKEWRKKHPKEAKEKDARKWRRRLERRYKEYHNHYDEAIAKSKVPKTLTQQESLAYTAGCLDGEGCIYLHQSKDLIHNKTERRLVPGVNVANTDRRMAVFIHDLLKWGSISRSHKKHRWKSCWVFQVSDRAKILDFLVQIRPYLKLKHKQADLLMEYCLSSLTKSPRSPYTEREKEIFVQMKILNQRGKHVD